MAKPFWTALSELKIEDEITVYWDDGTMYVTDESDGKATENVSLFQAYKFAVLIQATIFDYTASDEEIKYLSEQLLELIDEDDRAVNVWKYLDDIAEDFEKLTNIKIDIDQKRAIVSYMTEMGDGYDLMCGFGSVSYISKMLWDYIKGDERKHISKCDNIIINHLADKYLQADDYDLFKFAEELHKECEYKMDIPKNFNEYLIQSHSISEKCYYLLGQLIKNNREYEDDILVGYIDWFGDYEENERYIYCHIDSTTNEIYFHENKENAIKNAYLHDIAFPHLVVDQNRIQKDIKIKLTEQYIDKVVKDKIYDIYGSNDAYFGDDWGYNYCHMYGTIGTYTE